MQHPYVHPTSTPWNILDCFQNIGLFPEILHMHAHTYTQKVDIPSSSYNVHVKSLQLPSLCPDTPH
jgi:hypothetical protein